MLAVRPEPLEKTVNDNEGAEMCSEDQKTGNENQYKTVLKFPFWKGIFTFSENKWTGLDWMVKVLTEINKK